MNAFYEFAAAAFPWTAIALILAVIFAGSVKKETQEEQDSRPEDYGAEGMCLGMSLGVALGASLDSVGTGMNVGMLTGLVIGSCIRKESSAKNS